MSSPFNPKWITNKSVRESLSVPNAQIVYSAAHVGNIDVRHMAFLDTFGGYDIDFVFTATNTGATDKKYMPHVIKKEGRTFALARDDQMSFCTPVIHECHFNRMKKKWPSPKIITNIDFIAQNSDVVKEAVKSLNLYVNFRRRVTVDGTVVMGEVVTQEMYERYGICGVDGQTSGYLLPVEVEVLIEMLSAHIVGKKLIACANMQYLKSGRVRKVIDRIVARAEAVYGYEEWSYTIVNACISHIFVSPMSRRCHVDDIVSTLQDLRNGGCFEEKVFPVNYRNLKPRFLEQAKFNGLREAVRACDLVAVVDRESELFYSQHDYEEDLYCHPWQYDAPIEEVHVAYELVRQITRTC